LSFLVHEADAQVPLLQLARRLVICCQFAFTTTCGMGLKSIPVVTTRWSSDGSSWPAPSTAAWGLSASKRRNGERDIDEPRSVSTS
jgi:hypothetical protein